MCVMADLPSCSTLTLKGSLATKEAIMKIIKALIKSHPLLSYFFLIFAISWGGGLIVIGPGAFLGTREISEELFLLEVLVALAGPSVSGILLTGLVDGRACLGEFRSRLLKWRVGAHWYAVALLC